jgi:hypothetical protein
MLTQMEMDTGKSPRGYPIGCIQFPVKIQNNGLLQDTAGLWRQKWPMAIKPNNVCTDWILLEIKL